MTTCDLASSTSADYQHGEWEDEEEHAGEKQEMKNRSVVHGGLEAHELQHHAFVKRLLLLLGVPDVVGDERWLAVVGSNAYKWRRFGHSRFFGLEHRLNLRLERLTHVVEHGFHSVQHRKHEYPWIAKLLNYEPFRGCVHIFILVLVHVVGENVLISTSKDTLVALIKVQSDSIWVAFTSQ